MIGDGTTPAPACVPVVFLLASALGSSAAASPAPAQVLSPASTKGENGQENSLTIFARISFYSVGNENGKVRNRIRSVKFGPSKTDKSEPKCPSIDRQTVI
jgi:hypothetical protein